MPYELIYEDRGFIICFFGNISINDLNQGNDDIQGHEKFDSHRYQIVDLRKANLTGIALEETEVPATTDYFASFTNASVRIAMVVSDVIGSTVCREFIHHSITIGSPWEYGVFHDYDEALMWAKT